MNQPLFETYADATLDRVRSTYAHRGTEYGDSWRNTQWLSMKAVCNKLGIVIPVEFLRAMAIAALCDVKYNRLEGGYKDDTIVDSIAYYALLAEEMRRLSEAPKYTQSLNKPTEEMIAMVMATQQCRDLYGGGNLPATVPEQATAPPGYGNNGRVHV